MTPEEFDRAHWDHGFPWCDTCKRPAIWSDFGGSTHSTPEHPFGVPIHADPSGHEVTMWEWWAAPSSRNGPHDMTGDDQ